MNTWTKVAAGVCGLLVLFGAAFGIGRVAAPALAGSASTNAPTGGHAGDDHAATDGAHGGHAPAATAAAAEPAGLAVARDGHRLVLDQRIVEPGPAQPFAFHIEGPDGHPVTTYTRAHDKDLHFIVVRRDLTGFQHVHPTRDATGTWRTTLNLSNPGAWRVFADFDAAGDTAPLTLGADLFVPGPSTPEPIGPISRTFTVDGFTVALDGDLTPGAKTKLNLTVSRGGAPVTDLQPYLAAYGHLVALREGDLAYLHVHPDGSPGDGTTTPGPRITFHTTAPSAGSYRLFLDFQHGGVVRTAVFTLEAGATHGH